MGGPGHYCHQGCVLGSRDSPPAQCVTSNQLIQKGTSRMLTEYSLLPTKGASKNRINTHGPPQLLRMEGRRDLLHSQSAPDRYRGVQPHLVLRAAHRRVQAHQGLRLSLCGTLGLFRGRGKSRAATGRLLRGMGHKRDRGDRQGPNGKFGPRALGRRRRGNRAYGAHNREGGEENGKEMPGDLENA